MTTSFSYDNDGLQSEHRKRRDLVRHMRSLRQSLIDLVMPTLELDDRINSTTAPRFGELLWASDQDPVIVVKVDAVGDTVLTVPADTLFTRYNPANLYDAKGEEGEHIYRGKV